MALISWRCRNGHSRVLPWARSLRRVSGRLASRRSPFVRKKQKRQNYEVYISKHNAHSTEKTYAKRNRNESDYNEFPHYKHTFAESESQSEAVKRNDIMLHITSHSESFPERDFQKTDDGGINYCKLSHWLKEWKYNWHLKWRPFHVRETGCLKSIWGINSNFHAIRKRTRNGLWQPLIFPACYFR